MNARVVAAFISAPLVGVGVALETITAVEAPSPSNEGWAILLVLFTIVAVLAAYLLEVLVGRPLCRRLHHHDRLTPVNLVLAAALLGWLAFALPYIIIRHWGFSFVFLDVVWETGMGLGAGAIAGGWFWLVAFASTSRDERLRRWVTLQSEA